MGKIDTPKNSLLKTAANLTTAYASGWEFVLGVGESLSGVVNLDLEFASVTTLTLRWAQADGRDSDARYERAKTSAGTSSPDVHALTIADWETVDVGGTDHKRIAVPVDVRHGTRVVLQAKVDSVTGTPKLAAAYQPDNQAA